MWCGCFIPKNHSENRIFNQDMKSTKNDKMLYIIGQISDYIIELLLYKRKSNYYEFYQISYTFLVDYHMLAQPIQEYLVCALCT